MISPCSTANQPSSAAAHARQASAMPASSSVVARPSRIACFAIADEVMRSAQSPPHQPRSSAVAKHHADADASIPALVDLPALRDRGDLRETYGLAGADTAAYLIRPDGHVGFRARPFAEQQLHEHLALVFASLDFAIMFSYAVFGSQAMRFLKAEGAKWLERACGGALLALAGSLALYRRAAS